MKNSEFWKQREIALANCPNDKALCGDTQSIELGVDSKTVTVGAADKILTTTNSCSYIATSKCLAPTVDIGTIVNKDTTGDIYNIYYLEYSMLSVEDVTFAH